MGVVLEGRKSYLCSPSRFGDKRRKFVVPHGVVARDTLFFDNAVLFCDREIDYPDSIGLALVEGSEVYVDRLSAFNSLY